MKKKVTKMEIAGLCLGILSVLLLVIPSLLGIYRNEWSPPVPDGRVMFKLLVMFTYASVTAAAIAINIVALSKNKRNGANTGIAVLGLLLSFHWVFLLAGYLVWFTVTNIRPLLK